jgi:CBS domain-containing protein
MWDGDLGYLPVVDDAGRVVGTVTDRDVCMCAYTCGAELRQVPVDRAMSRRVHTCRPEDSLQNALALMAEKQVRRLPVTDDKGKLIGVVTINDIARGVQGKGNDDLAQLVLRTQVQITMPRRQAMAAAPSPQPATASTVVQPAERKARSSEKPATKTGTKSGGRKS